MPYLATDPFPISHCQLLVYPLRDMEIPEPLRTLPIVSFSPFSGSAGFLEVPVRCGYSMLLWPLSSIRSSLVPISINNSATINLVDLAKV